MADCIRTYV